MCGELTANKSLQRTFDPPPIFTAAKTGAAASNAAELRRYTATQATDRYPDELAVSISSHHAFPPA